MNIAIMLCLLVSAMISADDSNPPAIPAGAVPYEETVELPDKSLTLTTKISGYKLQINGRSVVVGPWKEALPTGEVIRSGFYDKDGKKTGVWKTCADGKTLTLMTFQADQQNGLCMTFRPDGIPAFVGWFKDGRLDGLSVRMSADGRITQAENHKDGKVTESIGADPNAPGSVKNALLK
jgi:hypothetical protein